MRGKESGSLDAGFCLSLNNRTTGPKDGSLDVYGLGNP